jgi:hypothetical protein
MRRALAPFGLFLLVTLALTWPLLLRFASAVAPDAGDPLLNSWLLWWSTRTLPLTARWWDAPMFYPAPSVMALSELLLGVLPISAPVQWLTGDAVIAYNTAFVLSFPLCGLGAYTLAYELTGRRGASVAAGLAFMLAPYRMGQLGHLQMLAYYGAPAALAALHRYHRTRSRAALACFGAAWLIQTLSNGYALFHMTVLIGLWILWFARRPRQALPIVATWLAASLPLAPILLKYWQVHGALHLSRDVAEIKRYSADLADFVSVPEGLWLWGRVLPPSLVEATLFPGLTMLAAGAIWGAVTWRGGRASGTPQSRHARFLIWCSMVAVAVGIGAAQFGPLPFGPLGTIGVKGALAIAIAARLLAAIRGGTVLRAWQSQSIAGYYVLVIVVGYVLAFGPEWRLFGRPIVDQTPYAWLLHLPGFDGMRVPARFVMIAALAQAALLAVGLARVSPLGRRALLPVVASLGVLLDGWVSLPVVPLQPGARADWRGVQAIAELSFGKLLSDGSALHHATAYSVPVVNGYSGYTPAHYAALVTAVDAGNYDALHEVAPAETLAVVMRADTPEDARRAATVGRTEGVVRQADADGWAIFHVLPRGGRVPVGGATFPIIGVQSSPPGDAARMHDGNIDTAWTAGPSQVGDEQVTVDLGAARVIGAVTLQLGPFAAGFPRRLVIETSPDGVRWATAWQGTTAAATVRAGLDNPRAVPLTLEIAPVSAQFVRLRQTGSAPGAPWRIAELEVHAAPGLSDH